MLRVLCEWTLKKALEEELKRHKDLEHRDTAGTSATS